MIRVKQVSLIVFVVLFACSNASAQIWGAKKGRKCPDGLCNDNRKLKPIWIDIWGTDFKDKILTKENVWDVIKVGSHLYVTGNILRADQNFDLLLRKYTENGELIWEKTWDNGVEDCGFVLTNDETGIYVGGFTKEPGPNNKALLQKYDFDGNLLGTKKWGDISRGHHEIDGLAVYGSSLYVSHWQATWGFAKSQAVVKKFDISGTISGPVWSRSIGDPDKVSSADGHIHADATGVWITGRLNSEGAIKGGDAYLAKIDAQGNLLWTKTFGGAGYDNALSLASDGDHIYVTGMDQIVHRFGRKEMDGIIAKFDLDGNLIWEKRVGGNKAEFSRGVDVDNDHVYVVYSTFSWGEGEADTILTKYDKATGDLVDYGYWGKEGTDQATPSLVLDEDSVYLCGKTTSFGPTYDAVVMRVPKDFQAAKR